MTSDDPVHRLLADLEAEAADLARTTRAADVAEQARLEYAEVDLASRLRGSLQRRVRVTVEGVGRLSGLLVGTGRDWIAVDPGSPSGQPLDVVAVAALLQVEGLGERVVLEVARSPLARLGLGSMLRRLEERDALVLLTTRDGVSRSGRLARVGADFAEVDTEEGAVVVPFTALARVRG